MPLTGVGSLLLSGVCGAFVGLRCGLRDGGGGEGIWILLLLPLLFAAAGVRLLAGGPFLCRGPSALTPHFLSTAGNQTVNHLNSPQTRP
jgi:hypothetical protein